MDLFCIWPLHDFNPLNVIDQSHPFPLMVTIQKQNQFHDLLLLQEFYRQSLAENMVDGFLLMSLTDHDMVHYLGIDSRVVRKKIMQQILQTLDKEHKQSDNWHLRARAQRAKPDVVYLIYDPADVRLAQNIKADLKKKSLQVRSFPRTSLNQRERSGCK